MTLATRGAFTGAFSSLDRVEDFEVSGFRSDIPDPSAVYANGKTHLSFIRENGDVLVATYDHAARSLSTPVLVFSGDTDPHGNIHHGVALCRRSSDGRLIVGYSQEGDNVLNFRISTDAESTSAWGSPITAGSGPFTFISLYEMNGSIYAITKRTTGWAIGYCKSANGGASWGSFVPLLDSGGSIYWKAGCDGSRIDIYPTDTLRSDDDPSSVYHCYLDASEDLRASDGALIGVAASGPYDVASSCTLIKDDSSGPARCQGWGYDASGNPACLVFTYVSSSNVVHVATWDGEAWSLSEVCNVGGWIAGNRHVSSGAMVHDDPDYLFIPTKVGSHFELFRYRKQDATWYADALTAGSSSDYAMPDTPLDASPHLRCILGFGTYLDQDDFDFTLVRFGQA